MSEAEAPPPISRVHLEVLSDDRGIMQHATGSVPDPAHGYCTDDVARALLVDLLHARGIGWFAVADSAKRHLLFLDEAFDSASGRFRNMRRADGSWVEEPGSEDCHGRAMVALGETIANAPDESVVGHAASLFSRALPAASGLSALRAMASTLLGCDAVMRSAPTVAAAEAYRLVAGHLGSVFTVNAISAWPWPEGSLTYENALPVQALIVAGKQLDDGPLLDTGLRLLDWLIDAQTARQGHLSPIGNGWWESAGAPARFDQQPIEATSLLLAAESAYATTGDESYRETMVHAYEWFLGHNDLGLGMADRDRGACFDGLSPTGVNANQGAESTLMWLIALEHIRALEDGWTPLPSATIRATPSLTG